MAPGEDDLLAHANDTVDYYDLLSISPLATDSEIRTAFRKTSLKYHPDKVGATPENIDKFLLVKLAHDVLSDPNVRKLYDQTREAKERKKLETEKLEAGRRRMVSELERRERDARTTDSPMGRRNRGEETPEQKLAREIGRISEENRRKKEEIIARRARETLEEEERLADEKEARERLKRAKERGPQSGQPDIEPDGADLDEFLKFERSVLARLRSAPRPTHLQGGVS